MYTPKQKKLLLQSIILIFALLIIKAEKVLRFGLKKYEVWTEPTIFIEKHEIDESVPKFDISLKLLRDVTETEMHVDMVATSKADNMHYVSFNFSHSLCNIYDIKNASPITQLVYMQIKKLGHLPDNCPIKKDTYSLNGIWPDDHSAKLKLPEYEIEGNIIGYVVDGNTRTKSIHISYKAEAIYKEVSELKRHGIIGVLHNVANAG